MKDDFIGMIYRESNERLDTIQKADREYMEKDRNTQKKLKKLNEIDLNEKENRAIDELLTAYNEENSVCCEIMYRQGFLDCILLLKEIGIINR